MEIEHIDEHSIRVLICMEDLEKRGINLLEMMESQVKTESFFYSIIEEFNIQDKFEDMSQVSFQLMPSAQFHNSIELVISCGDSPVFQDPLSFMDQLKNPIFSNGEPALLDPSKSNLEKKRKKKKNSLFSEEELLKEKLYKQANFVLEFMDFEAIIELVQTVNLESVLTTSLFDMNQKFYLHVFFDLNLTSKQRMENIKSVLREFGKESKATIEELQEHGRQLSTTDNALQELRQHFC
ncbi:MAG: adaptor protein MecA [Lactobacillales bacterium]|jgi:adapter protein MecA 1/2|nr:adaptor protein MecA [Lactobacillales bacterium]